MMDRTDLLERPRYPLIGANRMRLHRFDSRSTAHLRQSLQSEKTHLDTQPQGQRPIFRTQLAYVALGEQLQLAPRLPSTASMPGL